MRTTTTVHSREERTLQRQRSEQLVRRSQWRLMLCVSVLLRGVTCILPLAGAASWWVTAACLLPGLALYWIGCTGPCLMTVRLRRVISILAAVLCLMEAITAMTALLCLFTEGIGTEGTQGTMAVSAAVLLLLCVGSPGLARGVYFLRWPLLVMGAAVLAGLVGLGKMDHLFPMLGNGGSSLWAAFRVGVGMAWPLLIPLMEEPLPHRWRESLLPMGGCILMMLCLNLALPQELLTQNAALADAMVQTVTFLHPGVRLIALCLFVMALFLAVGNGVGLCSRYALIQRPWLPGVLALAVAAMQFADVGALWQGCVRLGPWMLAPLGLGAILALWRRS